MRPTQLTRQEATYLAEKARMYANIASISRSESTENRALSSSVSYQEKLVEAEQASQAWTRLQTSWRSPFEMTVSLISESALPQSAIAALQSAIDGTPAVENQPRGTGAIAIAQTEPQKMALRQNWADLTLHRWANTYDLDRLPWLFSPEEIHSIFRLPLADRSGVWGIPLISDSTPLGECSMTNSAIVSNSRSNSNILDFLAQVNIQITILFHLRNL